MTNEEILVSFKQSTKPLQQVRILAELNGTDQETIRQILEKQGVDPAVLHRKPRVQKKIHHRPSLPSWTGWQRKKNLLSFGSKTSEICCLHSSGSWKAST